MIRLPKSARAKLELGDLRILLVGAQPTEQEILAKMFMGFGAKEIIRCRAADQALELARDNLFNLALIEVAPRDAQGYELVRSIRLLDDVERKQLPIIMVRGHARQADVFDARDCGANLVLTKPISPRVLFDHIVWLAQDRRAFLECDTYRGPDRRFKACGPPKGVAGRRHDDDPAPRPDAADQSAGDQKASD